MEQKFERRAEENSGDANEEVTLRMAFSRKYIKATLIGIVMSLAF